MTKGFFITGIGTEVGKTVASAVMVRALNASYWKPTQAGDLQDTDTDKVVRLTGCCSHPERYRLQRPMSPHAAAAAEGICIQVSDFRLPECEGHLIVEGAGGVLVPLNDRDTMLDLMVHLALPVIVVSRHYLGSINHTLLTVSALRSQGVEVAGILFNGDRNEETESVILGMSGLPSLGRIPVMNDVTKESVASAAQGIGAHIRSLGII